MRKIKRIRSEKPSDLSIDEIWKTFGPKEKGEEDS